MRNKEYNVWRDTIICMKFRLKQIMGEPKHLIPLFLLFLLLVASFGILKDQEEEKSRIPIGVVLEGEDKKALELLERLKEQAAFSVTTGTTKNMVKLLEKEDIQLLFVIPSDLSEKIKDGNTDGMIRVMHLKGNTSNTILSDIVTGEFMDEICNATAKRIYHKIGEKQEVLPDKMYETYREEVSRRTELEYKFDIQVVNTDTKEDVTEEIKNVLLYRQVLFSIILVLLSFFLLFAAGGIAVEQEKFTEKRLSIGLFTPVSRFLGNFFAVFLIGGILSSILCAVWFASERPPLTAVFGFFLLFSLYLLAISLFLLLLGKLCKSVTQYQLTATLCIFAGGVGGFFEIVSTLLPEFLLKISKITPNSWFIQGITDIMVNGRLLEKGKNALAVLTVMGAVLAFLLWVQDKKRQRS